MSWGRPGRFQGWRGSELEREGFAQMIELSALGEVGGEALLDDRLKQSDWQRFRALCLVYEGWIRKGSGNA